MAVKTHIEGSRFAICFWVDDDGECPVENYILKLVENDDSDAASIIELFDRTARSGLINNEQKFKHLKGRGQGLVEFKARGGTRVLGFIVAENKLIVCTHGIPKLKPKRFEREMDKAQEIKRQYEIENMPEESNYAN